MQKACSNAIIINIEKMEDYAKFKDKYKLMGERKTSQEEDKHIR